MRLAIQEQLVPGETHADRLAAALDAGFEGLELRDAGPDRLRELAPARGRAPTVCPEMDDWVGGFDAAARRRAIDRLHRQLEGIAALGGHGVITPAAWADTYHMNIEEDDPCRLAVGRGHARRRPPQRLQPPPARHGARPVRGHRRDAA
jgi:hypothetical protein